MRKITVVAFDTETFPIIDGLQTPKLVVMSAKKGSKKSKLYTPQQTSPNLKKWLSDGDTWTVAHNIGFDIPVVCREDPTLVKYFVEAAEENRLFDTLVRERLINNALGELAFKVIPFEGGVKKVEQKYSLSELFWKRLGKSMAEGKGFGSWRLNYNRLYGVPHNKWPDAARQYALDDATICQEIFLHQATEQVCWKEGHVSGPGLGGRVLNEDPQVKAAMALGFMSSWGLKASHKRVVALETDLLALRKKHLSSLLEAGIYKVSPSTKSGISRNMAVIKELITEAYEAQGDDVPTTAKGNVKTCASTLKNCCRTDEQIANSRDPEMMFPLERLLAISKTEKLLSTFLDVLKQAALVGINPGYNVLMQTGRTSSYGPNIQQVPTFGGVRECFVARPGFVMGSIDYDSVEMATLAQTQIEWFGESKLADAINSGKDPHLMFAATLLGKSYKWCAKARKGLFGEKDKKNVNYHRTIAKVANFGFPGGLGAYFFTVYAQGYGLNIDETYAKILKKNWIIQWNMAPYFEEIRMRTKETKVCTMESLYSGRLRGQCDFKQACNNSFQGMAADGVKHAMWELFKACYYYEDSPLFGSRMVAFIHDEILFEFVEDKYVEASAEASRIMIESMRLFVKDVHISAEAALMYRWYKDAEPLPGCKIWYKLGTFNTNITQEEIAKSPVEVTVIVGPSGDKEFEDKIRGWGYEYQSCATPKQAAQKSDCFLARNKEEVTIGNFQGAIVL